MLDPGCIFQAPNGWLQDDALSSFFSDYAAAKRPSDQHLNHLPLHCLHTLIPYRSDGPITHGPLQYYIAAHSRSCASSVAISVFSSVTSTLASASWHRSFSERFTHARARGGMELAPANNGSVCGVHSGRKLSASTAASAVALTRK